MTENVTSKSPNGKGAKTSVAPKPDAQRTVSHMLGEITWLLSQSKTHKHLFIADLEWLVMPAVLLEQFRIFYGPKSPAAVAIWAKVSPETDKRLRDGEHKLRADEWKGGDITWLIELVSPFGAEEEILTDLKTSVFEGTTFNYHTIENGNRVVKSQQAD